MQIENINSLIGKPYININPMTPKHRLTLKGSLHKALWRRIEKLCVSLRREQEGALKSGCNY